jgi:hypothetical protein
LEVPPHSTTFAVPGTTVEVVLARTWYCMHCVVRPLREGMEYLLVCTGE